MAHTGSTTHWTILWWLMEKNPTSHSWFCGLHSSTRKLNRVAQRSGSRCATGWYLFSHENAAGNAAVILINENLESPAAKHRHHQLPEDLACLVAAPKWECRPPKQRRIKVLSGVMQGDPVTPDMTQALKHYWFWNLDIQPPNNWPLVGWEITHWIRDPTNQLPSNLADGCFYHQEYKVGPQVFRAVCLYLTSLGLFLP